MGGNTGHKYIVVLCTKPDNPKYGEVLPVIVDGYCWTGRYKSKNKGYWTKDVNVLLSIKGGL